MSTKKTALLSVSDKAGLLEFASQLIDLGFNLLGSGGTATHLNDRGIPCRNVAEIVGPPILGHRVVTLSREIHVALLATNLPEDRAELDRLGIPRIDLVYVNLYPLEEAIKRGGPLEEVIEKTDIGGPTLLRAAAKGRRLVVCQSSEFPIVMDFLRGKFDDRPVFKEQVISGLVAIAERHVADYCLASSKYHAWIAGEMFFSTARSDVID